MLGLFYALPGTDLADVLYQEKMPSADEMGMRSDICRQVCQFLAQIVDFRPKQATVVLVSRLSAETTEFRGGACAYSRGLSACHTQATAYPVLTGTYVATSSTRRFRANGRLPICSSSAPPVLNLPNFVTHLPYLHLQRAFPYFQRSFCSSAVLSTPHAPKSNARNVLSGTVCTTQEGNRL